MRLCTYEIDGPLGRLRRVGAAVGGRVNDVNLAYALMVFERDRHPRHRALADVLVPADMLALLETEGHGLTAAREALAHLGERAADPDVRGPAGELLSHAEADLRLLAPLPRPPSLRDGMAFEEHVVQAFRNMRQEPPKVFYELPLYYKSNPRSFVGT